MFALYVFVLCFCKLDCILDVGIVIKCPFCILNACLVFLGLFCSFVIFGILVFLVLEGWCAGGL